MASLPWSPVSATVGVTTSSEHNFVVSGDSERSLPEGTVRKANGHTQ